MRLAFPAVLCAVLIGAAAVQAAGPPPPAVACPPREGPVAARASAALSTFYHDPLGTPPWRIAFRKLQSPAPEERRGALDSCLALLDLAFLDECGGRPAPNPELLPPEFRDNPARAFRALMGRELTLEPHTPEWTELAVWFLSEEPDGGTANSFLKVLQEGPGGLSNDLLKRLLDAPVRHPGVHRRLLEAAAERHGAGLGPEIVALCGHPRKSVRNLARALTERLHLGALAPFDPAAAVTDWIDSDLRELAGRVAWPVPENPRWVHVKLRTEGTRWDGSASELEFGGWLLEEAGRTITVLDWRGDRISFDRGTGDVTRTEMAEDLRALEGLRGQIPGEALLRPDLRELLMAAWAHLQGNSRLAAEVLLPMLYPDGDDPVLADFGLEEIGTRTHHAMLTSFRDLRDYPKTRFFARHMSGLLFAPHRDRLQAIELDDQLERRTEDFVTLTLPTEPEWEELKRKLSRSGQIEYLAQRLRLLNCFETRLWEPYPYDEPQSAVPRWTWDLSPRFNPRRPVINPYIELGRLDLRPEDVTDLARHLDRRWFILAYTCRHAVGERCPLHRVPWLLAERINAIAGFPLVRTRSDSCPDAADLAAEIDRVMAWARTHAGQTDEMLALDQLTNSADAVEVVAAARRLVRKKTPGLEKLILQRMAQFPEAEAEFACLCHKLDSKTLAAEARLWTRSKDPRTRYWSSLILLGHGDRKAAEGLKELSAALAATDRKRGCEGETLERAALALLSTGCEEAIQLVCALLTQPGFRVDSSERTEILKGLCEAGRPEAFEYLMKKLGETAPEEPAPAAPGIHNGTAGTTATAAVTAKTAADETAHVVAEWSGTEYDDAAPPEVKARGIDALRAWLAEQLAAVKQGKKPVLGTGPARGPKK